MDDTSDFEIVYPAHSLMGKDVFPQRPLTQEELLIKYKDRITELEAKVNRSLLRIIWGRIRGNV